MTSNEFYSPDSAAERAAGITASQEATWQAYCKNSGIDTTRDSASNFYYPLADKIANSFGFPDNPSDSSKRELINYEIYKSLEPSSALFTLMNNPAHSELLNHLLVVRAQTFSDLDPSFREIPVHNRNFEGENEAIHALYVEDPELVDRLVLTRTVGRRPGIKKALDSTSDFLEFASNGPADEERKYYSDEDLKELKELIPHNKLREREYAAQLGVIDQLVAENIAPLSPEELYEIVKRYLSDLIKQDEDRLNPFSKHPPAAELAGSIALKAWSEQQTGKNSKL